MGSLSVNLRVNIKWLMVASKIENDPVLLADSKQML